jgi:hypothetical protein
LKYRSSDPQLVSAPLSFVLVFSGSLLLYIPSFNLLHRWAVAFVFLQLLFATYFAVRIIRSLFFLFDSFSGLLGKVLFVKDGKVD